MINAYENGKSKELMHKNRFRIDHTWKWTLSKAMRNTIWMIEYVSITCIV